MRIAAKGRKDHKAGWWGERTREPSRFMVSREDREVRDVGRGDSDLPAKGRKDHKAGWWGERTREPLAYQLATRLLYFLVFLGNCADCMKRRDFLEKWGLTNLKIKVGWLEGEFAPRDPDREAAWELYIELLTRVTTQRILPEHGDEKAALDSVYAIFPLTREILRRRGSGAGEFAKLAIPVLNQIIRPFTAKWHRLSLAGAFGDKQKCAEFRDGLAALKPYLRAYATALADMAGVEDLTELEEPE